MDFDRYIEYIRNTGRVPLPVHMFDEDWNPIGPVVREDMVKRGLILITDRGIMIVQDARDRAARRRR